MASVNVQLSLLWVALLAVVYWNVTTILPVLGMLLLVLLDTAAITWYMAEPFVRRATGVTIPIDLVYFDVSFLSSVLTATACGVLMNLDDEAKHGEGWRVAFATRSFLVVNVIAVEAIMAQWPRLQRGTRLRTGALTATMLVAAMLCWAYFATVLLDETAVGGVPNGLCRTVLVISLATLVLRLAKTLVKMVISWCWRDDFDPRDASGLRMDLAEAVLAFIVGVGYAPSGNLPWLIQIVLLQRLYRLVTCTNNCRRYEEIVAPFPVVHGIPGDCVICLDDFKEPLGCRKLRCGHHFHDVCLRKWLMQSPRCPTCRQEAFVASQPEEGLGGRGAMDTPRRAAANGGGGIPPGHPLPLRGEARERVLEALREELLELRTERREIDRAIQHIEQTQADSVRRRRLPLPAAPSQRGGGEVVPREAGVAVTTLPLEHVVPAALDDGANAGEPASRPKPVVAKRGRSDDEPKLPPRPRQKRRMERTGR
jgi:hypothetical protein